jgi:hypothetical protein
MRVRPEPGLVDEVADGNRLIRRMRCPLGGMDADGPLVDDRREGVGEVRRVPRGGRRAEAARCARGVVVPRHVGDVVWPGPVVHREPGEVRRDARHVEMALRVESYCGLGRGGKAPKGRREPARRRIGPEAWDEGVEPGRAAVDGHVEPHPEGQGWRDEHPRVVCHDGEDGRVDGADRETRILLALVLGVEPRGRLGRGIGQRVRQPGVVERHLHVHRTGDMARNCRLGHEKASGEGRGQFEEPCASHQPSSSSRRARPAPIRCRACARSADRSGRRPGTTPSARFGAAPRCPPPASPWVPRRVATALARGDQRSRTPPAHRESTP